MPPNSEVSGMWTHSGLLLPYKTRFNGHKWYCTERYTQGQPLVFSIGPKRYLLLHSGWLRLSTIVWCWHWPTVSTVLWMRWDKFTWTTEILWRKRDDTATLAVKERAGPLPCLDRLYCFSGHIASRMVLIYHAQVCFTWLPFTENKGEDVGNYIKKEGDLQL